MQTTKKELVLVSSTAASARYMVVIWRCEAGVPFIAPALNIPGTFSASYIVETRVGEEGALVRV